MESLPFPTDAQGKPFEAINVYDVCISKVKKTADRKRLRSLRVRLRNAAAEYDVAAAKTELHTFPEHYAIGEKHKNDMKLTYASRMVNKKQPGRDIYDRILVNARNRICPLCGLSAAQTLDHHLPKVRYPVFAVLPNNLIPSCYWCQVAKKESYPSRVEEETIHPYFDDFETDAWLHARVLETNPAIFQFFVSPPSHWSGVVLARLSHHLSVFQLDDLYSRNAADMLCSIRYRLENLFRVGGKIAVQNHLQEEAASAANGRLNHWRAAMYRSAAASKWFCEGGFMS